MKSSNRRVISWWYQPTSKPTSPEMIRAFVGICRYKLGIQMLIHGGISTKGVVLTENCHGAFAGILLALTYVLIFIR